MNALRTWMFAGVIALAGGTTAFVALDSSAPVTTAPETVNLRNAAVVSQDADTVPQANLPESNALLTGDTFQLSFDDADVADEAPTAAADPQNAAAVNVNGEQLSAEARTFLQAGVEIATADAVGMSVADLQAARDAGQRMDEILDEAGVTREELQAAVESAWPSIVQSAEDAGLITAEQAATLIENGPRIGRGGPGRGRGEGQGPGGRRGQDGQGAPADPNRNGGRGQGNNG